MSKLLIHFDHPQYLDTVLGESITGLLDDCTEFALATTNGDKAHISIAHFAYNRVLDLYILTPPYSQHIKNLDINPSVALAIWDAKKRFGEEKREIIAFGACERVQKLDMANALRQYSQRFRGLLEIVKHPMDFAKGATDSRLFVVKVSEIRLLDEQRFGKEKYIYLKIKR